MKRTKKNIREAFNQWCRRNNVPLRYKDLRTDEADSLIDYKNSHMARTIAYDRGYSQFK